MNKNKHLVGRITPGSIAEEMDIQPGDEVVAINGQEIEDIFDYHYLMNEEYVEMLIRKPDGEEWLLEIEKEFEEDAGIEFQNPLMDEYRSCSNKCVFCFIDQMPKGMRDTLYFKDDDSRLSFLQGNYVTLTNMSDHDIDRIIRYHLSPINVSFHTTNPELRCKLLHNRFAGDIFDKVKRLYDAGITMNGQIVLCKGLNDGAELEKSIRDLSAYAPVLESLSVVPVGLTGYRDGLYPLVPFGKEDAIATLEIIERWQKKIFQEKGIHFVHGGDEWYLLADKELPEENRYDGYLQLENGVGMIRLLDDEVRSELEHHTGDDRKRKMIIATGELAAPYIREYANRIREKYPKIQIEVKAIKNNFFGNQITVAGLITGKDLLEQLDGCQPNSEVLIPCNMLRSGESVFLDDITVKELEEKLNITIRVVDQPGKAFVDAILGNENASETGNRRQMYEQADSSYSR